MHNKVVDQIFRRSIEKGWGALRFNFRGAGKTFGAFDHGRGESEDMLSLCEGLGSEHGLNRRPWIFLGYSFGAWVLTEFMQKWKPAVHSAFFIAPPVTWYAFQTTWQNEGFAKHVYAAEKDDLIDLPAVQTWFGKLSEPKKMNIVEGAGHYFHTKTALLTKRIMEDMEDAWKA